MSSFEEEFPRMRPSDCLRTEGAIAEFLRLSFEEDTEEEFAQALVTAAQARARLRQEAQDAFSGNVVSLARSFGYGVSFTPPAPAMA